MTTEQEYKKTGAEILKATRYNRVLICCGFFKTMIAPTLLSIAIGAIILATTKLHYLFGDPIPTILFSSIIILITIILILALDWFKKENKKYEEGYKDKRITDKIDNAFNKQEEELDKLIDQKIDKILEKKFKEMNN